jgi:hypothetical protein
MALRSVPDPAPKNYDVDEYAASAAIAETLREQAANMPLHSEMRALALRSANRWSTIAGTGPVSLRLTEGGGA